MDRLGSGFNLPNYRQRVRARSIVAAAVQTQRAVAESPSLEDSWRKKPRHHLVDSELVVPLVSQISRRLEPARKVSRLFTPNYASTRET